MGKCEIKGYCFEGVNSPVSMLMLPFPYLSERSLAIFASSSSKFLT